MESEGHHTPKCERANCECEIRLLTSVTARCYDKVSKECLTCDCLSVRLSVGLLVCPVPLSVGCPPGPLLVPHRIFLKLAHGRMLLFVRLLYSRFLCFSIAWCVCVFFFTYKYIGCARTSHVFVYLSMVLSGSLAGTVFNSESLYRLFSLLSPTRSEV